MGRKKSIRQCSVDGCDNKHLAIGFCAKHWYRFKKYGDPLGGNTFWGEPMQFLNSVIAYEGDDCIAFPFGKTKGYGKTEVDGGEVYAHRFVCEKINGPAPSEAHQAAHSCGNGNKACVTPRHLYWATHTENQADRVAHGTHNRGRRQWMCRLDEGKVISIRGRQGLQTSAEVAAEFGISARHVRGIWQRRTWAWM